MEGLLSLACMLLETQSPAGMSSMFGGPCPCTAELAREARLAAAPPRAEQVDETKKVGAQALQLGRMIQQRSTSISKVLVLERSLVACCRECMGAAALAASCPRTWEQATGTKIPTSKIRSRLLFTPNHTPPLLSRDHLPFIS